VWGFGFTSTAIKKLAKFLGGFVWKRIGFVEGLVEEKRSVESKGGF
jgi:hypothetical protein